MSQHNQATSNDQKRYGAELNRLLRRLTKQYETMLSCQIKESTLTVPQLMVLKQIYSGQKTLGQIAQAISLSNSTVSGVLDRLERDGWVERERDEADRRVIWIRPTDKFADVRSKFPLFQDHFFDELFDDLSPAEIENVVRSIEVLVTHLERKSIE